MEKGQLCWFWKKDPNYKVIGTFFEKGENIGYYMESNVFNMFENCEPLSSNEIEEFKKFNKKGED